MSLGRDRTGRCATVVDDLLEEVALALLQGRDLLSMVPPEISR